MEAMELIKDCYMIDYVTISDDGEEYINLVAAIFAVSYDDAVSEFNRYYSGTIVGVSII